MLCNLFFLLALLCGAGAAVRPSFTQHQLRYGQKISHLSGDALIQAACSGVAEDVAECISALQSARPDQKADANALVLFTLGYVRVYDMI